MREISTLPEWRQFADQSRSAGQLVGLVPTMGALHAGHTSLIERARHECDSVIVTIFVNARQFSNGNDLAGYPSSLVDDRAMCVSAGVHALVVPSATDMWPPDGHSSLTTVSVGGVASGFEGASRPGHFDGVASVVAKLFNLTGACRAYFGEKDFQQLAVIRQMVSDLAMPIDVVGCSIVRDSDGLALSSRNIRLSLDARHDALGLFAAVREVETSHSLSASDARQLAHDVLSSYKIDLDYVEIVDPVNLSIATNEYNGLARLLVAGTVDGVRLLDNGPVRLVAANEEHRATGN